jgi:hypothetical protein
MLGSSSAGRALCFQVERQESTFGVTLYVDFAFLEDLTVFFATAQLFLISIIVAKSLINGWIGLRSVRRSSMRQRQMQKSCLIFFFIADFLRRFSKDGTTRE